MSAWREVSLDSVAQINPTESLSKGTLAKKIAMDALQPFTKKPASFEFERYNGGMKFKNGDTCLLYTSIIKRRCNRKISHFA